MRDNKILEGKPWVINLRGTDEPEVKSEWGGLGNMRFAVSSEQPDEATIFVVDADGTHAIGLDGKPKEMKPDLTPCSCDEYRKQGIEEGWIDE